MTAELSCGEVQDLAPELALGAVAGSVQERLQQHLEHCSRCRQDVAELTSVADRVLLLGPVQEPPSGFEQRVVARLVAEGKAPVEVARPRWRRTAYAAVLILLLGSVALVAALVGSPGGHAPGAPAVATLVAADGQPAGRVVLDPSRPVRMTCTVDTAGFEGAYGIEVTRADGHVERLATFSGRYRTTTWSTELDIDMGVGDVRQVAVRGSDGVVRSTATFAT
ncbi:MAG: zf-HC2 domain-containing protein [Acidimicrobiales bacterium]